MNLRGFEQDFTKDLESFVKRPQGWEPITPLKTWSAKKTAAPERHKVLGFESGLSPQTQIYLLDNQNTAFDIIESMLRIYLSPIEYNTSDTFTTIDVDAEQVWLFAMRWLEHYYECLMEPLAIRTEFYKHSHMKFLELMRKMLSYNPKKRITFYDALKFWYPSSTVFVVHPLNELDSSSMTDPDPLEAPMSPHEASTKVMNSVEYHIPAHAASESSVLPPAADPLVPKGDTKVMNSVEYHTPAPSASESVETPSAALPVPPVSPAPPSVSSVAAPRSRLALKRPDGLAGHNKTRRHPRNSGRSPAIGNRGTRARD